MKILNNKDLSYQQVLELLLQNKIALPYMEKLSEKATNHMIRDINMARPRQAHFPIISFALLKPSERVLQFPLYRPYLAQFPCFHTSTLDELYHQLMSQDLSNLDQPIGEQDLNILCEQHSVSLRFLSSLNFFQAQHGHLWS